MIKVELTVDELDYGSLVEQFLPELAEKLADAGVFSRLDGAVGGIVGTEDVLDMADFLGIDTRCNRIAVLADVFQLFVRGNPLFDSQGAGNGHLDATAEELADLGCPVGMVMTCFV